MRYLALSTRNLKEIVRDPISAMFGLGLPLVLLVLFTQLGKRLPAGVFKIQNFAPGMVVFGFSFLVMFSALLLAQDKKSSFLMRLFASPLTPSDYILSYTLPLLPLALLQCVACLGVAVFMGLPLSAYTLLAVAVLMPQAVMTIFAGLLFGAVLNEKQVQGVGNVYIIVGSLLSGAWLEMSLLGGGWSTIAYALPFAHSVDAARAALAGDLSSILPNLMWPIGYAAVIFVLAAVALRHQMEA